LEGWQWELKGMQGYTYLDGGATPFVNGWRFCLMMSAFTVKKMHSHDIGRMLHEWSGGQSQFWKLMISSHIPFLDGIFL
jgi:hypothetical protein